MQKCLFVGGPADGTLECMPERSEIYYFTRPILLSVTPVEGMGQIKYEQIAYRCVCQIGDVRVFGPEGVTYKATLERLIDGFIQDAKRRK